MSEPPQDEAAQHWKPWQCVAPYIGAKLQTPYQWQVIEIWREGWAKSEVIEVAKLHPLFNVYGLWWRPWPLIHPRFDGP